MDKFPAYLRWPDDGMIVRVLACRDLGDRYEFDLLPIYLPEDYLLKNDGDPKTIGEPFVWGHPQNVGKNQLPWDGGKYEILSSEEVAPYVDVALGLFNPYQCPKCCKYPKVEGDYLCHTCRFGA